MLCVGRQLSRCGLPRGINRSVSMLQRLIFFGKVQARTLYLRMY